VVSALALAIASRSVQTPSAPTPSARLVTVMVAPAGWCAGAAASLGTLALATDPGTLRPARGMLAFALVFVAGAWLMQWAHLGWWMIKAARLLSGSRHVFNLSID
jgi:hypothetical protein